MIYTVEGDIFDSNCNVIAHNTDCMKGMGTNFGRSLRDLYSSALFADRDLNAPPKERLGHCSVAMDEDKKRKKKILIFNLYGQLHYGVNYRIDLDSFELAVGNMYRLLDYYSVDENLSKHFSKGFKIGMPYDLGGKLSDSERKEVKDILSAASHVYHRDIYLYRIK